MDETDEATTRFLRVSHKGVAQNVGVYAGLPPLELSKLLAAVFEFGDDTAVVGLRDDETGTVYPISMACAAPQLLTESSHSLLLTDSESMLTALATPPHQATVATPRSQMARVTRAGTADAGSRRPSPDMGRPKSSTARESRSNEGKWAEHVQHRGGEGRQGAALPRGGRREQEEEVIDEEGRDEEDTGTQVDAKTRGKMLRFIDTLHSQGLLTSADLQALKEGVMRGSRPIVAAFYVALYRGSAQLLAALWKSMSLDMARGNISDNQSFVKQDQMLEIVEILLRSERVTPLQHVNLQHLVLLKHEAILEVYETFRQDSNLDRFLMALTMLADAADAMIKAVTAEDLEQDGEETKQLVNEAVLSSLKNVLEVLVKDGKLTADMAAWILAQGEQGNELVLGAHEVYMEDDDEQNFAALLLRILKIEALKQGDAAEVPSPSTSAALEADSTVPLPKGFKELIMHAVKHKVLLPGQSADLYHLFGKGDRMLRAAWEVFLMERNLGDFLDTLLRISRIQATGASSPLPVGAQSQDEEKCAAEETASASVTRSSILAQCVDVMMTRGLLDLQGVLALKSLLKRRSDILIAALDAFVADKDLDELLDTLRLLAAHAIATGGTTPGASITPMAPPVAMDKGVSTASTAAHTTPSTTEADEIKSVDDDSFASETCASDKAVKFSGGASVTSFSSLNTTEDDRSSYLRDAGDGPEVSEEDQLDVLSTLADAATLTRDEQRALEGLAAERDRSLASVFASYAANRDAGAFRARLKDLAASAMTGRKPRRMIGEIHGEDRQGVVEVEEEEDTTESEDGQEYEDDAELIADRFFMDVVSEMDPPKMETAALRVALVRSDPTLKAAMELFKNTNDRDDLEDTLWRIARQTILEVSEEAENEIIEDEQQELEGKVESIVAGGFDAPVLGMDEGGVQSNQDEGVISVVKDGQHHSADTQQEAGATTPVRLADGGESTVMAQAEDGTPVKKTDVPGATSVKKVGDLVIADKMGLGEDRLEAPGVATADQVDVE